MRPRPSGRGESGGRRVPGPAHPFLQCGHGLRVVENDADGEDVSYTGDLQCGHGLRVVENPDRRPQLRVDQPPSMRPRPSGRGEQQGSQDFQAVIAPSMRPRPSGRGERLTITHSDGTVSAFNAATAFGSWRTPGVNQADDALYLPSMRPRPSGRGERVSRNAVVLRAHWGLQCGHGLRVVENLGGRRQRHDGLCPFNAATAFGSWRTPPARR